MSGFFAAMIICVLISLPILGTIIGVRAILKKPIQKLAIAVAICAASIIPLTILGVLTDPATWCDHQYIVTKETPSTCTTKGEIYKHCDLCGKDKVDDVECIPHTWHQIGTTDSTCTSEGYKSEQCEVCGATQKIVLSAALGHAMQELSRQEPTIYVEGKIVNKCNRCGYEEASTIAKLDPPGKNAPRESNDGVVKYTLSEDKIYYIVSGVVNKSSTSITIPNVHNDIAVKAIGEKAFDGCKDLLSLSIPNSITRIGTAAFSGCGNLEKLYITDIAAWCNITFEGYSSNPLAIAKNFYLNGEFVKELVIPEGVTSISESAFSGYTYLTAITLPSTLKSIGQNAFQGCKSLKNAYISDLAAWCNVSINGYDATPLSEGGSLYLNGELITDLVIPESVRTISKYAFYGFITLESVTFHNKITSIDACAFAHCIALTSISFPDSVTNIGKNAFYNCYRLKDIEMGSGIAQIGEFAFEKCNAIKSFTYNGRVEDWNLVKLDRLWEGYVHHCAIKCKDGVIATNGTVTYN